MTSVTYDDRSFIIDGQRVWLVSGAMHYFRIPADLWADRLLKAKRAGLNCIETYIAWNFHEPVEGQWDFSGDRDILQFVRLAEKLGLYVILRPGPYICAEWDFGGLPGWLAAKSGVSYRSNNAAFMHYFDKYFAKVLPQLAAHQVSVGGNIVLIQNENEYYMTTQPDRGEYLDFITQLFRRSGFTIPIITCNNLTEPQAAETIECLNTHNPIPELKRLRMHHPNTPLLVTEFYTGWFDNWDGQHQKRPARQVARKAMEILGCGAQCNYYMWHGGTNFEFWGSHHAASENTFQTTSYDYDAPLAEGGGLTEKYYFTRLVNLLADSMGPYFASGHMEEPGASIDDASFMMNLHGSKAQWAIVTNNGRDDIESVTVSLPCGTKLDVSLKTLGATAIPYDLKLPNGTILNYCSLGPLGLFGSDSNPVLILHAPAGTEGTLSVNFSPLSLKIPTNNTPTILEHHKLKIVLVTSELAMRTWPLEQHIAFGPDFVGETLDDITPHKADKQYFVMSLEDGKLHTKKTTPPTTPKPAPPRLANWKRTCICPEPVSNELEWQKLDRPRNMDKLGTHYGYGWYRIRIDQARAQKRNLFLPDCADRASLYLNGSLVGVWGVGKGATREPIKVDFKKGVNNLVALVDNLGRTNSGERLGGAKGIFGHVYDAKPLRTNKFKLKPAETFPRRIVPRNCAHLLKHLESAPLHSAELSISLTKVLPIHLSFTDIPHHAAVFCNDRMVGFFAKQGANWGSVTLGADLKKGKNIIRLLLWGDVNPDILENIKFHTLVDPVSAGADWGYRPWSLPEDTAREPIKGKSCWYTTTFRNPQLDVPLFLKISGATKGQIYVNGHNAGRFWTIGPQEKYYLPACWLGKENELTIFEEHGTMPANCKLEYCPAGPFGK
ncbi:MAG: beta-galactosidase [Phycisphaerae bacterium]|nr:beta-galactosidase [Phycisphaerae bacterium]